MQNLLGLAISIASRGFQDKTDKSGKPYILHCLRVMNAMDQKDEELMQIAVLHDVVEDTNITVEDLISHGFSPRVLEAVVFLTHHPRDSYDFYIKLISNNPDAVKVKL